MSKRRFRAVIVWPNGDLEMHSLKGSTPSAARKSALYLSMRPAAKRREAAKSVRVLEDHGEGT